MRIFEEARPATLEDVSWLRKALARRLEDLRLSAEIINDLQITVSEIATNAVVHCTPKPTTLEVSVDIAATGLTIEIIDDGGTFVDFAAALQRAVAAPDLDAFSGRGLALARDAMSQIDYKTTDRNRFIGKRSLRPTRPTVLVVEDTAILLQIYRGYLKADYKTIGCVSLEEARAALKDVHIDVVLADVHLGDGLGTALANEMDSLGSDTAPPVVLISSDTSDETRERALRLGAEFFIAKPVRANAMRDTIAMALTRAVMRRARLAQSFVRHVDGFAAITLPGNFGWYRAATASGTASTGGGDLVLYHRLPKGERIVLVDVMGHGIAAKAWAIAYAAIIRTLQRCRPDLTTSAFLTDLAEFAWNEPALEHAMATVLVVDFDDDGATISSAGHPAPLLLRDTMGVVAIDGPLLGVLPPEPYSSARVKLEAGDRLVMMTDGLDPATVASGDELPSWFADVLSTVGTRAFDDATAAIQGAADAALGPQPPDDWTIITIEKVSP
jgi:anti-sigma regulatory factor (Ser/Thr protein kinase)/CheY-like chemotaxis protein